MCGYALTPACPSCPLIRPVRSTFFARRRTVSVNTSSHARPLPSLENEVLFEGLHIFFSSFLLVSGGSERAKTGF